ncbi:MAG TPA: DUF3352 domain-containing protein [Candidatus Sumerlaeota bacterium]|nr:DUF3352 domain-containing protein [Candidatus Sumerlaeota bacterium]HPS01414.1 DUF3352 domain-containing protein [Candidatus Sumerlaeota bacterium]
MMTKNKPADSTLPRSTWKRRALHAAAVLLFLLAVLGGWLKWRSGRNYYGEPETLLPPDTAVLATWRQLGQFIEHLNQLKALQQIQQDEDFLALLLADPDWRKLQNEKDKARYKFLKTAAHDFIQTWFGREFSLALLPPQTGKKGTESGGLIAIARTDLGFEENLAEFVAQCYPELSIEERRYRGHRLYRYNAEKSKRAFSYCRFGDTVVVSFRSADWGWLERVIDRKLAYVSTGSSANLAHTPIFSDYAAERKRQAGLDLFVSPQSLSQTIRSLPANIASDRHWGFWLDYADEKLQNIRWGAFNLDLDKSGLNLESFWKYDTPPPPSSQPTAVRSQTRQRLETLPAGTALALTLESPALRRFALELRQRMAGTKAYAKSVRKFDENWKSLTGVRFAEDFVEPMQASAGVAVTGMVANPLFPIPQGVIWWELADPQKASTLLELIAQTSPQGTPTRFFKAGTVEFQTQEQNLFGHVNRQGGTIESVLSASPSSASGNTGQRPLDHPMLQPVWSADNVAPVLCLFADFETCYDYAQRLHRSASIWSKEVRKDFEFWQTVLGVLRHLHALRLTATPRAQGIAIQLLVSVD